MVRCLKVRKRFGEAARLLLLKKGWLDHDRLLGRTKKYLLFPLKPEARKSALLKKFEGAAIEERALERVKKPASGDLKQRLVGVIPDKDIELVKRSFDVVGDIAVLEIPKELEKLEQPIAWTLYRTLPNIKVVAKKAAKTTGKFRIRRIKVITGEKRTSTIHREAGIRIKLDLNKVYFSPRLGRERLRIARQVKPKEKVLVMFSGIGPYALVIAKQQPAVDKIYAVELNPAAFRFMRQNIKLNKVNTKKVKKIVPLLGDVRKVVPNIKEKFDRIVMPLPMRAHEYLNTAFKRVKPGTIIHLYQISALEDFPSIYKKIEREAKLAKKRIKILRTIKCGTYGPNIFRICVDFKVL